MSGCSGRKLCRYHCSVVSSQVHALPPNDATQLLGRAPSGPPPPSRHTYQSRLGEVREERDSTNHGCWSLVWFGTQSSITLRPASWLAAMSWSMSAMVPKTGRSEEHTAELQSIMRH